MITCRILIFKYVQETPACQTSGERERENSPTMITYTNFAALANITLDLFVTNIWGLNTTQVQSDQFQQATCATSSDKIG
jgi:hypothetical protein